LGDGLADYTDGRVDVFLSWTQGEEPRYVPMQVVLHKDGLPDRTIRYSVVRGYSPNKKGATILDSFLYSPPSHRGRPWASVFPDIEVGPIALQGRRAIFVSPLNGSRLNVYLGPAYENQSVRVRYRWSPGTGQYLLTHASAENSPKGES